MGKEQWNREGFTEVTLKLKHEESSPRPIIRDEGKTVPRKELYRVCLGQGWSVGSVNIKPLGQDWFLQAEGEGAGGGSSRTFAEPCFRQSPRAVACRR